MVIDLQREQDLAPNLQQDLVGMETTMASEKVVLEVAIAGKEVVAMDEKVVAVVGEIKASV